LPALATLAATTLVVTLATLAAINAPRQVHYRYGATPVAYAVTRQAVTGPCTCLSKQYTPEGAVLFKDIRAEKVSSRNLLQA
jgi:hypothetical protein